MNVQRILDIVCAYHGVTKERVRRGSKNALCSTVRRQTVALAREFTHASQQDIADVLSLAQFASVSYCSKRHRELMLTDPIYAREIESLRAHVAQAEEHCHE